ncbi:MAG: nucleotide-binding protein [Candidatus Methanomethylophilaceae archaeon]|nr:nucleotide-binding protein [Candidatus Methanomethylophilaceae archaeon]
MKDCIFVAWSGTNDIALQIKSKLEKKNYKCMIGGNSDNSSSFSSIGDTVIQQIKTCNQAIVIFQNKADGSVSNNLFFELGYVLASYGSMKVHCVRKETEDVILPSDFDNSFVEPIKNIENDEDFVNGILNYFFKRQKLSVTENKMNLINNRYRIHDYIQSHFSDKGSKCSDYELAQYLLFYMQAAHMFNDEKDVSQEFKKFKNEYHSFFSEELSYSVDVCISFMEMVRDIKMTDDGDMYLERHSFRIFKDLNEQIYEDIEDDDTGTFDEWCKVFIGEHLTYCYNLYANNPDHALESKIKYIEKTKKWAYKTLEDLKTLEQETDLRGNNDYRGLVSLFYAYVYRNLYICSINLKDGDELKWLEKSKRERTLLKNYFQVGTIDTQLYNTFRMEYYLTLIEYLSHAEELELDEDDVEDYKDEITKFIEESKKQQDQTKYILRIEYLVNSM